MCYSDILLPVNIDSDLVNCQNEVWFQDEAFKEIRMVKNISRSKEKETDLVADTMTGFMSIWFNLNVFIMLSRKHDRWLRAIE
jgi:hypothetical protein